MLHCPTFSAVEKWFNDTATMNSSLIDRSLTLLKNTFTEEYKLICMGNCKQSFQVYFQWFLDKHAHNNKIDGTTNKEVMQAQWNPADGFKTLVVQVTKWLIFAQYAGVPVSDVDVIDMGIVLILMTGSFQKNTKFVTIERQQRNHSRTSKYFFGTSSHHKKYDNHIRSNGLWDKRTRKRSQWRVCQCM